MPTCKILFLAASPRDLSPAVEYGREHSTIQEAVGRGAYKAQCTFQPKLELRVNELQTVLNKELPQLLHICAHGNEAGDIHLLDRTTDTAAAVPAALLATVLRQTAPQLRCVVLSACFSDKPAQAMLEVGIPFVIGMTRAITTDEACAFSESFYEALVNGRSLADAFLSGKTGLNLEGLRSDAVKLLSGKERRAAEEVLLTPPDPASSQEFQSFQGPKAPASIPPANPPFPSSPPISFPAVLRDEMSVCYSSFKQNRAQMDLLRRYKQIHDDLQGLEEYMKSSLGLFAENGRSLPFKTIKGQLKKTQEYVASLLEGMSFAAFADEFDLPRTDLEQAQETLRSAYQAQNAELLDSGLDEGLKRLLAGQLPRVNQKLVELVQKLNLAETRDSLKRVGAEMAQQRSGSPLPRGQEFLTEAGAFEKASQNLETLLNEHRQWQKIDDWLRPMVDSPSLRRLFQSASWPRIQRLVISLCPDSAPWSADLLSEQTALNAQLGGTDNNELESAFNDYYRQFGQVFNKVDRMLLSQSGDLYLIGERLYLLLKGFLE